MNVDIEKSWQKVLGDYFKSKAFTDLAEYVKGECQTGISLYPQPKNIFNAFNTTSFDDVKVVILGQDPYHGAGQAMGLSFSVPEGVKNPPSLKNIFKELEDELGQKSQAELVYGGDLTCWAKQGVLLINAVLTVEAGKPGSHANKGWEDFTDHVIKTISDQKDHVIFLLWGNYAKKKVELIDSTKHLILSAPHPSPFSAHTGFFGCNHFAKTNDYLKKYHEQTIAW